MKAKPVKTGESPKTDLSLKKPKKNKKARKPATEEKGNVNIQKTNVQNKPTNGSSSEPKKTPQKRSAEPTESVPEKKAKVNKNTIKRAPIDASAIEALVKKRIEVLKNTTFDLAAEKEKLGEKPSLSQRRSLNKRKMFNKILDLIKAGTSNEKTAAYLKTNMDKIVSIESKPEINKRSQKFLINFKALHAIAVENGVLKGAGKAQPKKTAKAKEEIEVKEEVEPNTEEESDDDDSDDGRFVIAEEDNDDEEDDDDKEEEDDDDEDAEEESEEDIAAAIMAMKKTPVKSVGKGATPMKKTPQKNANKTPAKATPKKK